MSLYAAYILEREGRECLETEDGFITFKINGPECYIVDVYVIPSLRRTRLGFDMADRVSDIAKKVGCTYLLISVDMSAKGAISSLATVESYGCKWVKAVGNVQYFTKDLK